VVPFPLVAVTYDPSSRGAQAYQALARELLQRDQKPNAAVEKRNHAGGAGGE
jgi:hypothetical protein